MPVISGHRPAAPGANEPRRAAGATPLKGRAAAGGDAPDAGFEPTASSTAHLTGESATHAPVASLSLGADEARAKAEALFGSLRGLPALAVQQLEVIAIGSSPIARRAREALEAAFADPRLRAAPAEERAAKVRTVFNRTLIDVISGDAPQLTAGRRSQAARHFGEPVALERFDFEVKGYPHRTPAERIDVTVNGRSIPVYRPVGGVFATRDGQPRVMHSLDEIARALSRLPPGDLLRVRDVRLSPVPNPEDATWAKQYGEPDFASYMNAGPDGKVTIFPWHPDKPKEGTAAMVVSMLHELGHVASNHRWGIGRGHGQAPDWTRWREAMKADGLFASIYAKASAEEDFAETYALRRLMQANPEHARELRLLLPNRVRLLIAQFPT